MLDYTYICCTNQNWLPVGYTQIPVVYLSTQAVTLQSVKPSLTLAQIFCANQSTPNLSHHPPPVHSIFLKLFTFFQYSAAQVAYSFLQLVNKVHI